MAKATLHYEEPVYRLDLSAKEARFLASLLYLVDADDWSLLHELDPLASALREVVFEGGREAGVKDIPALWQGLRARRLKSDGVVMIERHERELNG